ncbi:hypothetical protein [Rhodospirillum centenum]|uniref:hypothetical protein n=1 Tax=Rhodospirillum centenum TaxID=34018 RepID=UPI00059EE793|nr:hypothetical protein [Rhodospirillum centenum]
MAGSQNATTLPGATTNHVSDSHEGILVLHGIACTLTALAIATETGYSVNYHSLYNLGTQIDAVIASLTAEG